MNPLSYLKNMTSEDVQRIARTVLQFVAGALVTHGTVSANATWLEPSIGVGVAAITFAWQLYGNRLNAKLAEIAKMDGSPPVAKAADAAAAAIVANTAPKAVALLAILILGAIVAPTVGHAQTRLPHVTGRPIEDIKADVQDAKGGAKITTATSQNAGDILNQLRAKFSADVTGDLTSALALAQMVPAGCSATPPTTTACAPSDTTAIPCYQALISLNGVINSYTPPTDKPHVISDLEQLRIVARTIQSTNFKDACAPLVQDIQAQANQLVASVLGIVSGAAKIGIALP